MGNPISKVDSFSYLGERRYLAVSGHQFVEADMEGAQKGNGPQASCMIAYTNALLCRTWGPG
jgi:hypothetical protein